MRPWFSLVILGCLLFQYPQISRSQVPSPQEFWKILKKGLSGPDGSEYFEKAVKGALLLVPLEGTLISSTPADHPREFLVAVSDDKTPDITLSLEGRLEKALPAGTPVIFECLAEKFTPEPFMLTCHVETVNRATVPEKTEPKKKSK
jgi:hypothetical protein